MAATYEKVATTTLGSAQASYTCSSIPSTYTDLILVCAGTISTASDLYIQFNGDTASNYSKILVYGTGSVSGSATYTGVTQIGFSYQSTGQGVSIAQIFQYANTSTNKNVISRGGASDTGLQINVGSWRSTAAINSIKVYPAAANLSTGYVLTLYGIKAA